MWRENKARSKQNTQQREDNNRLCVGLTDCLRHSEKFIKIIATCCGKKQKKSHIETETEWKRERKKHMRLNVMRQQKAMKYQNANE